MKANATALENTLDVQKLWWKISSQFLRVVLYAWLLMLKVDRRGSSLEDHLNQVNIIAYPKTTQVAY